MTTEPELHDINLGPREDYVLQLTGDELRVGQRRAGDIVWYDEQVPLSDFSADVRSQIAAARFDSADVQTALRGVLQAFSGRGG
jgi:hypothetical protein